MPSTLVLLKEKYEINGKPYKETPSDLLNDLTSYQATSCFTLCYKYQLKVNNEKMIEQYSKIPTATKFLQLKNCY